MQKSIISELEKGMSLMQERKRRNLMESRPQIPLHACRQRTFRQVHTCKRQAKSLQRQSPTLESILYRACCLLTFVACYALLGIALLYSAPCGTSPAHEYGFVPLYDLVKKGDFDGVSALLANGSVHPDTRGTLTGVPRALGWVLKTETPILQAARRGYVHVVDALLKAGASVDAGATIGPFGSVMTFTPLHAASIYGHTQVVNLLLKYNASVCTMLRTPLQKDLTRSGERIT